MTAATWIAIAVLGPGALAVFIWFLADVETILDGSPAQRGDDDLAE